MVSTTHVKTPKEYIDDLEEPRRSEIKKLDQLIRKTMPRLKPVLVGNVLGYVAPSAIDMPAAGKVTCAT